MVVTFGLTRFTRIFPCTPHITSEETIKTPLEEWFCVYGAPTEIDLDEDIHIRSDSSSWYKRVLKALTMQVSTWIPYAPMRNPLCNVDFCLGHCFSETKYTPLNGCLLMCPYRFWHMRPTSIGLIPSLSANAKLSKVEQNTHMAVQLRCRVCPHIADNPPLPQPCKEVHRPCTIEAMDIIILLLVVTQSFPTNIRYSGVQAALIGAIMLFCKQMGRRSPSPTSPKCLGIQRIRH